MDTTPFQMATITDGQHVSFHADGDPTDEDQLFLFQALEEYLQNIELEYEYEDYGCLRTELATPIQEKLMTLRFRPYLPKQ